MCPGTTWHSSGARRRRENGVACPRQFGWGGKITGDFYLTSSRNETSGKQKFLKRRSYEEGRALIDAAHLATHRLYCDALKFWRRCPQRPCKRHRRCLGDPTGCLMRGLPLVPPGNRLRAQKQVIAGGPRRLAPATHIEWYIRRSALKTLVSWGFA
jgi:hypothetical protein